MLDFQQKRKLRAVLYSRVTLFILGVLVLVSLRAVWTAHSKLRESEDLRDNVSNRVSALVERDTELRNQINRLQTPQGVEAEIRSKLSVSKEGENVVVIVEDDSVIEEKTDKRGFWSTFFGFFTK